ncbi:MAG: ribosomal protein S18-alanine N-acetyltransferase [Actinomycetales bacterium]
MIRPMRWWDITSVDGLERELFPADAWSIEQFWEELAQPTRWYIVAEDGEHHLVGYAGLFLLAPDADVQTISVARSAQGRGVGRCLLTALINHAQQSGCRRLILEVRAGNIAAEQLYRKAGFEQVSRRSRYYPDGEDALVLSLPLNAATVPAQAESAVGDE